MTRFQTTFRTHSEVMVKSDQGKKHVVVLAGGMSAEREVSLVSSKGVMDALVKLGYKVTMVDVGADIGQCLIKLKPDVVYNSLHGTYGEDGCIPGLLNMMNIPYTHAGLLSSAIAFNKLVARGIFLNNGIKCADGLLINKSDNIKTDPMPRPYVIKPLSQGSSIGVIIVFPEDDFNFADYQYEYGDQILIEKYIKAREMQVAVLNGKALGVLEIKILKNRFYDYDTKYTDGMAEHIMPVNISESTYHRIMEIAEKSCNITYATKGIVRVEFLYEESTDEIYMLEVNTHPGMTPLSICPEIAAYHGISFELLVEEILKGAKYEQ